MLQKIIRVGHSAAVTLNKVALEYLDLEAGDIVETEYSKRGRKIIIKPKEKTKNRQIVNPEIYLVARSLLKRYLPAFKKLAKTP